MQTALTERSSAYAFLSKMNTTVWKARKYKHEDFVSSAKRMRGGGWDWLELPVVPFPFITARTKSARKGTYSHD